MSIARSASASITAIALAAALGSVSTSGQSATQEGVVVAPTASAKAVPVFARLATLDGLKAVPMSSRELEAVKGLHIHFTTGSNNVPNAEDVPLLGWHFVNPQENNLGNGQAKPGAGPGYSGLCGAALNSPALTIPGQNTTTGIGGGC